jgi:hypothetical protein
MESSTSDDTTPPPPPPISSLTQTLADLIVSQLEDNQYYTFDGCTPHDGGAPCGLARRSGTSSQQQQDQMQRSLVSRGSHFSKSDSDQDTQSGLLLGPLCCWMRGLHVLQVTDDDDDEE